MSESESLYGSNVNPEAPPAPPPAPALGLMDQIIGVFTEPVETFKKLSAAPSWAWALGAVMVVSIIVTVIWGLKVDADAMLRPIMEANPKIPAEQIDTIIDFQKKFMIPFGLLGVLFGVPIVVAFMAFIYWLIGKGMAEDQKPSYVQALSLATVPSLAMLPQTLLISVMCLIRPVGGLTPDKLSPSSVGFYLHPENPKLYALFCQIDPFIIFQYVLIFLGARYLLKLKPAGAVVCTLVALLLGVAFRVLMAK
ncbi:MAG: YIP1 family protein [Holophagaceae bacterium]|nr:YIP1 family protein [Holophagaceae bacterium]